MARRKPVTETQRGASVALVLIVLATAALLFLFAIHVAAAVKHSRVQRSWETTLGTLEDVTGRFPATRTNAAALEVERLAASLGVDIVPRPVEDRLRPEPDVGNEFEQVKKQVFGRFLQKMLERPVTGALDAPPADFLEYLTRHADDIAELRTALAASSSATIPVWHTDISKLMAAPLPNLLGHLNLTKLMMSAALERLWAGDESTALEYLDASWTLTRGLRDSPILINQLITIAETRMWLGTLRHVDEVPAEWIERLEFDYRGAFLQAMKYEGWVWMFTDPSGINDGSPTLWDKAVQPIAQPYVKYCVSDVSDTWRQRIRNLERVDAICDYDLSGQNADLNIEIPRWNSLGGILVPNLAGAVHRLARLELDVELTRLTIEANRTLKANDGVWPAELNGRRASAACPADSWQVSVQAGDVRIDFSRVIEWPDQMGPVLPTRALLEALGEAPPDGTSQSAWRNEDVNSLTAEAPIF
jgi:hypothetical protein